MYWKRIQWGYIGVITFWGSGFRAQGLGLRVWGLGELWIEFGFQGLGFRV